jgi:hypothetical protein
MSPNPVCNGQTVTITFKIRNNTPDPWPADCVGPNDPDCAVTLCLFKVVTIDSTSPAADVVYTGGEPCINWWDQGFAVGEEKTYSFTFVAPTCDSEFTAEVYYGRGYRGTLTFTCVPCECCACATFSETPAITGANSVFQFFNNATVDLILSEYTFCSGNQLRVNYRIRNTTGSSLGFANPQIIVGNAVKFDPTDIIRAGKYEVIGTSIAPFSTTYEPPLSTTCAGSRVVVQFPQVNIVAGFDVTYFVDFFVESTRLYGGAGAPGPAQIHGFIGNILSSYKLITLEELSDVPCPDFGPEDEGTPGVEMSFGGEFELFEEI